MSLAEKTFVFPVETGARKRRVRQPVERDVVEDVIPREALGLSVEDACDQRIAARVVVEKIGGEADWGIRDPVQRLRAEPHLESVADAVLIEKCEMLVSELLIG